MKNVVQQALFIVPIIALIVAPLIIDHKNKASTSEVLNSASHTTFPQFNRSIDSDFDAPNVVESKQFAMIEPFSAQDPFALTSAMQNPMNPAIWFQLMMNMANYMQMIQMMQQMAAMPAYMMNPAAWMNPHMMAPNQFHRPVQQPMHPDEYEEWYKQQQELEKPNN